MVLYMPVQELTAEDCMITVCHLCSSIQDAELYLGPSMWILYHPAILMLTRGTVTLDPIQPVSDATCV